MQQVSKWRDLAIRVAGLRIDDSFDLPTFSHKERDIVTMRAALAMRKETTLVRISVRSLPSGGIRIIRSGTWSSISRGISYEQTTKHYPVLIVRRRTCVRPPIFSLGLLGSAESMHRDAVPAHARCCQKGCVFLAAEEGLCRAHARMFEFGMSMEDTTLDSADFFKPWDSTQPYTLVNIPYEPQIDHLEQTLRVITQHRNLSDRHK